MLNVSQGLFPFISFHWLMFMFCLFIGVFGSRTEMGCFSEFCKHDEVEEHSILRLLERSRNCELMGGEL